MASQRIPYDPKSALGQKMQQTITYGILFRQGMEELDRVVNAYVDDTTNLTNDSGIASGVLGNFRNLLHQASVECNSIAAVQVNAGAETSTRQFLDAVSYYA